MDDADRKEDRTGHEKSPKSMSSAVHHVREPSGVTGQSDQYAERRFSRMHRTIIAERQSSRPHHRPARFSSRPQTKRVFCITGTSRLFLQARLTAVTLASEPELLRLARSGANSEVSLRPGRGRPRITAPMRPD